MKALFYFEYCDYHTYSVLQNSCRMQRDTFFIIHNRHSNASAQVITCIISTGSGIKTFRYFVFELNVAAILRSHNSEEVSSQEFSLAHTRYDDGKVSEHPVMKILLANAAPYSLNLTNLHYCCLLHSHPLSALLKRG